MEDIWLDEAVLQDKLDGIYSDKMTVKWYSFFLDTADRRSTVRMFPITIKTDIKMREIALQLAHFQISLFQNRVFF